MSYVCMTLSKLFNMLSASFYFELRLQFSSQGKLLTFLPPPCSSLKRTANGMKTLTFQF